VGWKLGTTEEVHMSDTVEREPMWDGNMGLDPVYHGSILVEREPMWDGNGKAGKRATHGRMG